MTPMQPLKVWEFAGQQLARGSNSPIAIEKENVMRDDSGQLICDGPQGIQCTLNFIIPVTQIVPSLVLVRHDRSNVHGVKIPCVSHPKVFSCDNCRALIYCLCCFDLLFDAMNQRVAFHGCVKVCKYADLFHRDSLPCRAKNVEIEYVADPVGVEGRYAVLCVSATKYAVRKPQNAPTKPEDWRIDPVSLG